MPMPSVNHGCVAPSPQDGRAAVGPNSTRKRPASESAIANEDEGPAVRSVPETETRENTSLAGTLTRVPQLGHGGSELPRLQPIPPDVVVSRCPSFSRSRPSRSAAIVATCPARLVGYRDSKAKVASAGAVHGSSGRSGDWNSVPREMIQHRK